MLYIPERHPVAEQTPRGYMMTRPWLTLFNQLVEILGLITTPGGIAPSNAPYLVSTADPNLTNELVVGDTPTVDWDFSVPGAATASVPDDAITLAKMQEIATDRLLGRDTAGTGNPELIPVSGGLAFTGGPGLQIADDGVTDTKLRDSAALSVIGRAVNSVGNPADIVAGADGDVLTRVGATLAFAAPAASGSGDYARVMLLMGG